MNIIQNIAIIPKPVSLSISSGKYTISEKTIIYSNPKLLKLSEYLKNLFFPATGLSLTIKEGEEKSSDGPSISLKLIDDENKLKTEGYILEVNPQDINLSAPNPVGILYGIQTLRQVFPAELESRNVVEDIDWEIPCLKLEDFPRFSWRGYMLDEARHFHGKEVVKRILDLMTLLKLNRFHWHLTDDQGWRIEIKKYPNLTEIGSKREETQIGGRNSKKRDGIPHSGYYSQEDIQEIINYAKNRFITIIPEIDIPAHTRAALASYPNLSCKGYPLRVSTHWGFHRDVLCVGKDEVFEFVQDVLNEIINLFPSKIIHIGGDEVLTNRWQECPDCQLLLKNEGLKDESELQVYFTNRLYKSFNSLGQKIICWNDALNDYVSGKIICQFWLRGKKKVLEHIKNGGDVIMSNYMYTYLDLSYPFIPLKRAYKFEPISRKVKKKHQKYVIGLEAPMWGELIPTISRLEWQTFPRLIAFAETGWTLKQNKNYSAFQTRLKSFLKRLDILGVNYAQENEFKPNLFKRMFGFLNRHEAEKGDI